MKKTFSFTSKNISQQKRKRTLVRLGAGIFITAALTINSYASETIWTKAKTIMQDLYTQILTISTIAAVVTAAIALLMMNFSKNGKTVDESRAWLKRIIITWAVLNGLGFIMSYITPFFTGGQWNG